VTTVCPFVCVVERASNVRHMKGRWNNLDFIARLLSLSPSGVYEEKVSESR
jgi:hypothetical protein